MNLREKQLIRTIAKEAVHDPMYVNFLLQNAQPSLSNSPAFKDVKRIVLESIIASAESHERNAYIVHLGKRVHQLNNNHLKVLLLNAIQAEASTAEITAQEN